MKRLIILIALLCLSTGLSAAEFDAPSGVFAYFSVPLDGKGRDRTPYFGFRSERVVDDRRVAVADYRITTDAERSLWVQGRRIHTEMLSQSDEQDETLHPVAAVAGFVVGVGIAAVIFAAIDSASTPKFSEN